MNNIIKGLSIGLLVLLLAACGGEGDSEASGSNNSSEENQTEESTQQDETTEEETSEPTEDKNEESETMTAEENENKEAKVGDTVTSEAGEQTMVSRTDDVGEFESGPITLTIEKVNGVSGKLKGQMAEMLETEEIEYIQVDMKVSNSSEEDVSFYASQAVLTTDTGEQLEPDMLLSDHIGGEYLGQVNKEGTSFYILQNSKAEEVNSITLHHDAPHENENFESLGEKLEIDVNMEK